METNSILLVREWEYFNCGSKHERDENVAIKDISCRRIFGDKKRT